MSKKESVLLEISAYVEGWLDRLEIPWLICSKYIDNQNFQVVSHMPLYFSIIFFMFLYLCENMLPVGEKQFFQITWVTLDNPRFMRNPVFLEKTLVYLRSRGFLERKPELHDKIWVMSIYGQICCHMHNKGMNINIKPNRLHFWVCSLGIRFRYQVSGCRTPKSLPSKVA